MAKPTKETEEMKEEPRGDLPPRPSDEVASPDPDARKKFESREEVDGFRMPRGLSLPQRRAWKKAIEGRENFAAKAGREGLRATQFLRETVGGVKKSAKEMGKEAFKEVEGLRELGTTVGPVVKEVAEDVVLAKPRAKAALYSDPEGAKEFGRAVLAGDRPAIRTLSEEVSKSAMEPLATGAEAVLGGLAAEEGKYGEAAMYGGMLLLPGVLSKLGPKMSKGWLKSAAEAGEEIPDEAAKKMNDLAKRVEAGDVTDDMQIRRELAGIEDAHKAEYMQSKPPGGGGGRYSVLDEGWGGSSKLTDRYINEMQDKLYGEVQGKLPKSVYRDQLIRIQRMGEQEAAILSGDIEIPRAHAEKIFAENADTRQKMAEFIQRREGGGKPPGGGEGYPDPYDSDIVDTLTPEQLREKALHDERSRMLEERGYDDDFDAAGSGDAELDKLMSVTSPSGLRMDQFQREVMDLPDSQFKDVLLEDIDEVMSLPDDFFDQPGIGTREESLSGIMELYEMQKQQGFPAIKSPVADADISIPSFEDLQRKLRNRDFSQRASKSMVDIEKAKEIMRRRLINDPSFHGRVAEAKQGQQLARSRVRGSRTPGTPGASGKIPEGTSRAEPKGTRRERPKKKDE